MRSVALALTLLAFAAAAEEPAAAWTPRKVAREKEDRTQILDLFRAMELAGKQRDLEAAAALMDFPVLMVTDDASGEAKSEVWSREHWTRVMKPFYDRPMQVAVKHKPSIFVVTDSLASVGDVQTMKMGKRSIVTRTSILLVRTGGKWRFKSMVQGGWGDAMRSRPAAQPDAPPR